MSTYGASLALTLIAAGTREVEGANISDPFKLSIDPDKYSTSTANKILVRKAISLTNGQSGSLDPESFTGPLGSAGVMSYVQAWVIQNTSEPVVGGTIQLTFGNSEFLEVQAGACAMGVMPLREATQRGWDASQAWTYAIAGGSGTTTGVLILIGNPNA